MNFQESCNERGYQWVMCQSQFSVEKYLILQTDHIGLRGCWYLTILHSQKPIFKDQWHKILVLFPLSPGSTGSEGLFPCAEMAWPLSCACSWQVKDSFFPSVRYLLQQICSPAYSVVSCCGWSCRCQDQLLYLDRENKNVHLPKDNQLTSLVLVRAAVSVRGFRRWSRGRPLKLLLHIIPATPAFPKHKYTSMESL